MNNVLNIDFVCCVNNAIKVENFFEKAYVLKSTALYSVILSVIDPRKCEYLKEYSLDFVHAYMTTYLAS